jgi:hypothetical protein
MLYLSSSEQATNVTPMAAAAMNIESFLIVLFIVV